MYSKSDNIEIMINDQADEVMKELFKALLHRDQNNVKKPMKVSESSMFISCIIKVIK